MQEAEKVVHDFFCAVGQFAAGHPMGVGITALVLAAVLFFWFRRVWNARPRDLTGNGITIGHAKAFDSSSLTLRMQRLNAGLEALKVVNQNITDNLSAVQARTSTETSASLSIKASGPVGKDDDSKSASGAKSDGKSDSKKDASSSDAKSAPASDSKSTFALGAGDALTNQLNLASQIFNLQTLYEGSLSDRMLGDDPRLQTVIGFQVSISPPRGYEDCVAIVEMAVRAKAIAAAGANPAVPAKPVSLVALMPLEKTFTAEAALSSERSLDTSALVKIFTLGLAGKRASRGAFVRLDPETVAFERKPGESPVLLDDATTFGWEFRPDLGRRAVSPGPRQLMAVIAPPVKDQTTAAWTILEIKTRSYWRRYNRKRQTSSRSWSWLPWRVDSSGKYETALQELSIPSTTCIQDTLAPKVSEIYWADSGDGKAYVRVRGKNFFPGTRVLIGGSFKQESDTSLTLKSEQVLEFQTPLLSLIEGDAVLIGRYGESIPLEDGRTKPFDNLTLLGARLRPMQNTRLLRLSLDIIGQNDDGEYKPFLFEHLSSLPAPILCVGKEPVTRPYDYSDFDHQPPTQQGQPQPQPVKYLRVETDIPVSLLSRAREVNFRIPFRGFDYSAGQPMVFSEPTVTRMGSDDTNTVFRIFFPQAFSNQSVNINLDRKYYPNNPPGALMPAASTDSGGTEYRFTVATNIVSKYQIMVLRVGKSEPYAIPIPQEEKPPAKASIDASVAPPQVEKDKRGPIEWQGAGLDTIDRITFTSQPAPNAAAGTPPPAPEAQEFTSYSNGTRLIVYLSASVTAQEGKVVLDCATRSHSSLTLPLFVVEPKPQKAQH